jgi:[acyl-carrier-protein] S-malonyltransferase
LLVQLSEPVRWTEEITAIAARFPEALYLELGPGSVLGGLVKKIAPNVRTASCGTVAEIEQAATLIAA